MSALEPVTTLPCDPCARRAWLIAALAGNLEYAWRSRRPLRDVLALPDETLIASLGGEGASSLRERREGVDTAGLRARWAAAGVAAVCRHDPRYPERLRTGPDAPAVLFASGDPSLLTGLAGSVEGGPPAVAIVGTRRPLPEAEAFSRFLGRGMAAAGVTVVSGMAMGIDAAAHRGALEAGGPTVAVLACGPERAYPLSVAAVHRRLVAEQLVVSELPPGTTPWRWAFPARNRIIAALGRATVVVEAAERSGSLITADFAADLGRDIGAVPGRAGSPRTRGSNQLLAQGAAVILEPADALDLVLGEGRAPLPAVPPRLEPRLQALLAAVLDGESPAASAPTPEAADAARVGLLELELLGLVRRAPGGGHVAAS
ncbi:DNA-processing protein DprA [Paraconexibacter antarcticus]|uniref:DNA-processing protein DprA n=1 Tax=Paraconexibacter antarcticus TaxID=2949664 RepID=A0ABY5DM83_9ACTN|nr:DNA-processing protein DprA [Paraconexibacter antarcticus]UTI63081.1 DNA-processing protein DprA [Paraconexibacter antarcticus]